MNHPHPTHRNGPLSRIRLFNAATLRRPVEPSAPADSAPAAEAPITAPAALPALTPLTTTATDEL